MRKRERVIRPADIPSSRSSIRARAPAASSPAVRRVMQANVGREPVLEKRLRSELHRMGLRFRKNFRPIEGLRFNADIVFRSRKVCVFVDGCFWHGCKVHFKCPKANASWWREKIQSNRLKDSKVNRALLKRGWTVLRFWEHEVKANISECACRVCSCVEVRS